MGGTWDTEQCKIVLKEKLTNISKCTKENGLKTLSITIPKRFNCENENKC